MTTEGVFSGQTVGIGVGGTGPVNVTISIDGHSGAFGYQPHGTAQMEYYRHVPIGSRLIDRQSQKMTLAARATAERKVFAHRS